jgi:hypothetical protein
MKRTHWYLAALAAIAPMGALVGSPGAWAGHLAILGVTFSIFFGTLSLGRNSSPRLPATGTPLPDITAQPEITKH